MPLDKEQLARLAEHRDQTERAQLQEVLTYAEHSPDAATNRNNERLANESGYPYEVVARNPQEVEGKLNLTRFDPQKMLREAPATARWIQQGNNAPLTKDNFEVMQALEKSSRATPSLLPNTGRLINERVDQFLGNLVEFAGTVEDDFTKIVNRLGIPQPSIMFGPDGMSFQWDIGDEVAAGEAESGLRQLGRWKSNLESGYVPNFTWENFKGEMTPKNLAGYMIEQGLPSVVEMGAALVSIPAFIAANTQRLAEERVGVEGKGRDVDITDLAKTMPAAVASSLLERFSGKGSLGLLTNSRRATGLRTGLQEVGRAGAVEFATEFAQEHIEYIAERFGVGEMSLMEGAERGLAAGIVGFGMGGTLRGASVLAEVATNRSERNVTRELNSSFGQSQLDRTIASIQGNTLLQESPEKMGEFLRAIGEDDIIYVTPEGVESAIEAGLPVPQHMRDQLGSGQDIAVPLDKFGLDVVASEELLTSLRPHMKRDPDHLTQSEIQSRDGTDVAAMIARAQEHRDVLTQAETIHQQITDQLVATGRMSPQSAKYSAQLIPAYVTTKVAELKARGIEVSVEQIYKDMNFRVERLNRESSVDGKILQQANDAGYEGNDRGEAEEWVLATKKFGAEGMTPEARKARAQEQGFDTDTVYYHGSQADITGFKLDAKKIGRRFIFVTGDPSLAGSFATQTDKMSADRTDTVYPLYVKAENSFDFDDEADVALVLSLLDGDTLVEDRRDSFNRVTTTEEALRDGSWSLIESDVVQIAIRDAGFDSFFVKELDRKNLAVLDPSQIRSVNAAFDPDFSNSPNILYQSTAPIPATPEEKLEAQRDALGFYSAVEQAVIDMKIPQWKDGGEVSGVEIWNKLKKTQGVKEEELLWTGLEEFLTGIPKAKFPRRAVVEFVRQNGVVVTETVATEDETREAEEVNLDWDEQIDDDSENWNYRVDDYMYQYDGLSPEERTEEFYFWDDEQYREENEFPSDADVREAFLEAAEKAAEEEYMSEPQYSWTDSDHNIVIHGSDSMGYSAYHTGGGEQIVDEVYSFSEAEIRVREWLYENDMGPTRDDEDTIAKWGPEGADYVVGSIDGNYPENYEEIKLKLPDMPFDYYNTTHFPDRNIVAFIRKTDREITIAPPEPGRPAEPTPTLEITEEVLTSDTIPDGMYVVSKKMTFGEYRAVNGNAESVARANKNWAEWPPEKRRAAIEEGNKQPPPVTGRHLTYDTFFIDEMQSDLQQQANAKGIKKGLDPEELALTVKEASRTLNERVEGIFDEVAAASAAVMKEIDPQLVENDSELQTGPFFYYKADSNGKEINMSMMRHEFEDFGRMYLQGTLDKMNSASEMAAIGAALEASSMDMDAAKQEAAALNEALRVAKQEREGAPDAPFKKDAWLTLAMKRAIMYAVESGADAFAWADAGNLESRWNKRFREAYLNQYDRKMPSLVKGLLKIQPVHLNMEGQPYKLPNFNAYHVERDVVSQVEDMYIVWDENKQQAWRGRAVDADDAMAQAMEAYDLEEGYWAVPLSAELKEAVRAEGFTLFQEGATQPRGEIQLLNEERIIRLSNTSDLSTFLHETGHLFLESEKMFADKYGMSANQEAILQMLGVESYADIETEHHELFARTFEDYLRTGKAPSLRLRDAFAAFARWLSHIYANIVRIGTKLDPEVSEVFDRLLATEVETQEVLTASPFQQYFQTQEQAGVSDREWADYLKKVEKRNSRTQMTLTEKVLKEYRARRKAEWKEEREPIRQAEEARLSQQPEYQLLASLKEEKMDYHAVAKVLGVTKLPTGKILSNSKTGGQDPEVLAEKYGYETVKDMLTAINETQSIAKQSMENAQRAMIEKYGDVLNDGTLDQEVREAAHNDAQQELLLAELRMIAKSKRKKPVDRKQLAYEAKRSISKMKHTDINPDKYYRAEIRAAEKAGKATTPEAAREAKETQLVNHYLYREARTVKDNVAKQIKYLKAAWTRKYSTSKVDGEYANAIKQYSGMYNAKRTPEERRIAAEKFLNWLRGQQTGGIKLTLKDQNIMAALDANGNLDPNFQLKTFNQLTADEVYSVYEMVKHLRYVGGVEAVAKNAELKAETDAVVAAIRKSGGTARVKKDEQTRMDTLRNSFSHIINTLPNLRNFIRNLDGDWKSVGGDVFDAIYRRVNAAENVKLVTTREFYQRFEQEMGDFSRLGLTDSRSSKERVQRAARPNDPFTLTANGRFMLAVYWGTESSRDAIMAGHDVSEAEVMEMMSYLTVEQLELVNRLWSFNESMAAPLFEAGIKRDGVAPAKLPPAPFSVNGVRLTGGHMTLHYTMTQPEVRLDEGSLAQHMQNGLMPSKATALHARTTSGGRMVDLNTHNITKSIDENAHYIGYAEVGMELQRILGNKEVKQAIIDTRGEGFYRAFMQSLQGVTTNRVEAEMYPWLAHVVTTLKSAKSAMYLMWNAKNVVQQLGSLYPAIRSAGPLNYASEAMRFYGTGFQQNVELVHSKSPQMANRIAHMNRESAEALKNAVSNTPHARIYQKVMQSGFTPHVILDLGISYPLWMSAYNKSLEAHGDESQAVIDADTAVNEAVGTGLDIGMGKALHSNQSAHIKLLTLFGSWFNSTVFQRAYTATKGGTDYTNAKALEALFITPMITMLISEAIVMNLPWGDEDEGEYEGVLMWFVRNMARFNSAAIPLMGGMISEIDGFSPKTLLQEAQALPGTTIDAIIKAKEGEMSPAEGFETFVKIVGTVVPMPGSGNLVRAADFAESFNQGAEGDTINVIDMYQAVVEGRDKNKE